jgi:DNA-binding NarL/FixJ family response regulator
MNVVGEGSTCWEIRGLARKKECDILILDISMPGRGGLEVLRELRREHPRLSILVLSMFPEDQYGMRALKAGASGYLTKESAPEKLLEAIRKILSGGKYISTDLAEKLAFGVNRNSAKPLHESLSDLEYHVVCKIASGKTMKEIAGELLLSVKTVNAYRSRILKKMKMRSNAALTYYAIKNHLIN